jgi:hypothetical protein
MTASPFSASATLLSARMSLEEVAEVGVPMLEESSHPQAYLKCGEIHDLGRTWADLRPLENVTLYESDQPQYVDWGGKYAHVQFADATPDQKLSIDTEVDLVIVALSIS